MAWKVWWRMLEDLGEGGGRGRYPLLLMLEEEAGAVLVGRGRGVETLELLLADGDCRAESSRSSRESRLDEAHAGAMSTVEGANARVQFLVEVGDFSGQRAIGADCDETRNAITKISRGGMG